MSYKTIDHAPSRLWAALVALLPACAGCGAARRPGGPPPQGFCPECLERSRESIKAELGGEG